MTALAMLSFALVSAPQVKVPAISTVHDPFAGQIIFSRKEVPAPSGLPGPYASKIDGLKISSIQYGSGNKARLHYAVFLKTGATGTRVSLTFVPVTATTPRSRLTTQMDIARKTLWAGGSVVLNEKTLGDQTYRVEATIGGHMVASGNITLAHG